MTGTGCFGHSGRYRNGMELITMPRAPVTVMHIYRQ
jgi:hypothetical protein